MKLAVALGLILALSGAAGGRAAPLEVYGRLPFIEDAAISPDGKLLAYSVTDGEARTVSIKSLESGAVLGGVRAGTRKVREIQWAGPNHLLITASVTTNVMDLLDGWGEWYMTIDYNLTTRKQQNLLSNMVEFGNSNDTMNTVDGPPSIRIVEGHPFAFVQGSVFVDHRGRLGLFKVDLDRHDEAQIIFQGFEHTDDYVVDAQGKPLAETEYDAQTRHWAMKRWTGHWQDVTSREAAIERPSLEGLGRDGQSIAVAFPIEDRTELRELAPDGKSWSDPVPMQGGLIHDPATHKLIGQVSMTGDETVYDFFDATDQAAWKSLQRAYAGSLVSLNSFSDDHRRFVLRVDSPTEGPAYAFVDMNTKRADWLGDEYQGLKPGDIGPKEAVSFKAGDGLALSGYLTLPNGKPAKNLPLVVFPHGGPAARDEPGFDWWAQAMASRGYAVLQVNYRGSDGFGWDHMAAGFGQWGRKMQTDLSDGVRYLAAQGRIDPKRVCIVGASYGGYAALAGASLDPGVYRCAASISGPSDLRKFVAEWKHREGDQGVGSQRYWLRYMGDPKTLDDISPAQQADKVTIPILIIHGKDDTVVPFAQSQVMVDALRKAGKPVEFVTLKHEDHWLSQGDTRLQMLQSVVAFLEKNNPPN